MVRILPHLWQGIPDWVGFGAGVVLVNLGVATGTAKQWEASQDDLV